MIVYLPTDLMGHWITIAGQVIDDSKPILLPVLAILIFYLIWSVFSGRETPED